MRLYHGLDEIGSSAFINKQIVQGSIIASLRGHSTLLYRRPAGSQGELKSSSYFRSVVGKTIYSNLDVRAVFEGDYYQLERFKGPSQLPPAVIDPTGLWTLDYPSAYTALPSQQINRSLFGLGSTFTPDTLMKLTTIIGSQWESREGFYDKGLSASFDAGLSGFELAGYRNNLNAYIEQEELGARMNRELRFNYGLNKKFSQYGSNRLEIYYRQKRHDYHIWGTSSIGTRLDTDQSVRNQLKYDYTPRAGFILDTELVGSSHEDRSQGVNSLREEVATSNALTLHGDKDRLSGWTRIKFDWGAQEDMTGLKHNRGTSLEGGVSWFPNKADSVALVTAVRKKRYDTSDTSNYDDRDRLRYEFDLAYGHKFSPNFRVISRAHVTMEHLVYIYGQKSDQNHWNRVFRLQPEVSFEPCADWHNTARFELVANSTDYDFELDPAFIKSTIYRRYTAGDSISWSMARGWMLSLEYSIDLEDGGRFLWDDWIQQISEKYRSQQAMILMIRKTHSGIRFDTGISVYERKGWEYTLDPSAGTVKTPFLYLSRWGPMIRFVFPSASGLYIQTDGDLSWVHEWNRDDYVIINLDFRLTWR